MWFFIACNRNSALFTAKIRKKGFRFFHAIVSELTGSVGINVTFSLFLLGGSFGIFVAAADEQILPAVQ
ncbi:hypothetical protein C7B09_19070 [Escherichia albertii]|uniref:Uncharacterized protein n=1 Tax=Escherichia albertii TaxID=208962 RepID=A0ABX5HEQ3_ESCAL|nr:hypothetical protein C7B09_19070 [Escherichia albertii]